MPQYEYFAGVEVAPKTFKIYALYEDVNGDMVGVLLEGGATFNNVAITSAGPIGNFEQLVVDYQDGQWTDLPRPLPMDPKAPLLSGAESPYDGDPANYKMFLETLENQANPAAEIPLYKAYKIVDSESSQGAGLLVDAKAALQNGDSALAATKVRNYLFNQGSTGNLIVQLVLAIPPGLPYADVTDAKAAPWAGPLSLEVRTVVGMLQALLA